MITIPRPHIPYGPKHLTEEESDAKYLREAADQIETFYKPFGSNLRATVVKLIRDSADAIEKPGNCDVEIERWKARQSEAAQESQRNRARYEAAEAECVRLQARAEQAEAERDRLQRIIDGYDRTPAEQRAADAEAERDTLAASVERWSESHGRLRSVLVRVRELAELDRKCPCCTGYDAILSALNGGE